MQTGNFVVYVCPGKIKEVTLGEVTALSRSEQTIVVHRYKPVTDNCLHLYWQPVYVEGGAEVLGSGSVASTETVSLKRLLFPVQMHDGVLAHAVARRFDHSHGDHVVGTSQPSEPCLVPAAGAVLQL